MALRVRHHQLVRAVALAVTVGATTLIADRLRLRADVTAEGLSRLAPETEGLIASIGVERPVTVHAFVSKDVPSDWVPVRSRLLNVLRELEARGGPGLTVRIVEPELFSSEAQEAVDNYGIEPRRVLSREGGNVSERELFLGVAFVSGAREQALPFIDRGLSVEYEVARALRVVTQEAQKTVGILRTDVPMMGDFDLQAKRQVPPWRIVGELRKQYEVRSVSPGAEIPDDIDVLIVPQLPSLTQVELDRVKAYVDAGRPALLTVDPMPLFDLRVAPSEPKLPPPGANTQMFGQPPQGAPKGDYLALLEHFGVTWAADKVLYDEYNPHPSFREVPRQVIFVGDRPAADGTQPFRDADAIVDGLNEVVVLFGGPIKAARDDVPFKPLLTTGRDAGFALFEDMTERHVLFGLQGPLPPEKLSGVLGSAQTIAARVGGKAPPSAEAEGEAAAATGERQLIVVADLDLFGDQFFALHEQGGDVDGDGLDEIRFDNVTFLLNAVDSLAGDDRFLALRKRRPAYRRLTVVDELTADARKTREEAIDAAGAAADTELDEARKALEAAVEAIRQQTDLDENTKAIAVRSAEDVENRRLAARTKTIERDKERAIAKVESEHQKAVDEVRNRIRTIAVLAPPIPALLLGALIFARKRRRERDSIPRERRARAAAAPPIPPAAADREEPHA
jgi:ABC-2 type transport system permease protein